MDIINSISLTNQRSRMTLPSPHFSSVEVPAKLHVPAINKSEQKPPLRFVAYCKFCREGFASDNDLFQHRRNDHEKCPYDDCKFNASSKAVAEHITRVHIKSNTLVKIQDLTTPEQIEKWREERRKRYPTASNVALRQQAREERFLRGEKLQDRNQRFGDSKQKNHIKSFDNRNNHKQNNRNHKFDERGPNNKSHDKSNRFNKNDKRHQNSVLNCEKIEAQDHSHTEAVVPLNDNAGKPSVQRPEKKAFKPTKIPIDEDSSDDEQRPTPRFKGTSQMKDYHKVETIVKERAALSILEMYGSESDVSDLEACSENLGIDIKSPPLAETVAETETPTEETAMVGDNQSNNNEDEPTVDDEGEAPDEVPIDHQTSSNNQEQTSTPFADKNSRKRKREYEAKAHAIATKKRTVLDYAKLKNQPSVNPFLEKLLQQDIRHERNILLQCVNFVVKNNFFDVGQSRNKPEESENKEECQ